MTPPLLRFHNFELDPGQFALRRAGHRIRLERKPMELLILLAEKRGQLVAREEIIERVWGKDFFFDAECGINNVVRKIRGALNDDPERPRFVETVVGKGYRFIGTVEVLAKPAEQVPPQESVRAQPLRPQGRKALSRLTLAVAASSALGLLVWGSVATLRPHRRAALGAPSIRSIAVLPFTNLSGDPNQEYFADGMTEELITEMGKLGALRVISHTSVNRFKATKTPLQQIARELQVDGVVEGTVAREAKRVRVTANLVQARTDRQLWAETYERDLGDVLKLQDEVAQAIVQHVRVQLTPQQQARLGSAPEVNPRAYEAFLQGRFYLTTTSNPQGIKKAQSYFEEAIQRDPGFAPAYAGLANCYLALGSLRRLSPQDAYRHGNEAIRKALQLNENLSEAHSTLGYLSWAHDWDWRTAERELNYAIELNPNSIQGHEELASFLGWSGRRAEALAEVARIRELDPAYPFGFIVESVIYYHLRDYKTMVEVNRQSVASNPDEWLGHYFLGVGYEGLGQQLEAIPEYQKAVELSQSDTDTVAALGHAYATIGRRAEAQKILRDLHRQSKTSYVSPYMIAAIYAGLGDKERAFEFLERAYQERSSNIPYFIKADLRIDTLRSDPRFADLIHRVGLLQ